MVNDTPSKPSWIDLDVTGHKCPIPILRLRRCLSRQASGVRIRVKANDPMTQVDIPHFCTQAGHTLLDQSVEGSDLYFLIKKAGD